IFMALQLTAPTSVTAEAPPVNREVWTRWAKVSYQFPGTARTSGTTLALTWHDGEGRYPPRATLGLPEQVKLPSAGSVLIGEQGTLLIPHGGGSKPKLFPEDRFAAYPFPELPDRNHHITWVDACRGTEQTTSPFAYAGPLTETVLLGTVAIRVPNETLTWNAA